MKKTFFACFVLSTLLVNTYASDAEPERYVEAGRKGEPDKGLYRTFRGVIERAPEARSSPEMKPARQFDGTISASVSMSRATQAAEFVPAEEGKTPEERDASFSDPRALLISPLPGSTLSSVQRFTWTGGYLTDDYYIKAGSCLDCTDIADLPIYLLRSATLYMPSDGRVIYFKLYTRFAGIWFYASYTFRAINLSGTAAEMILPLRGATLSKTQNFLWSVGRNVQEYALGVGSCRDCKDILDERLGTRLSRTVNLPEDGRTIYVTLFSYYSGAWHWIDYEYRAPAAPKELCRVNMKNQLAYGVTLLINGANAGTVPAGETRYKELACPSEMKVSWSLNRPTLSGRQLGDAMGGVWPVIESPSGSYDFDVDHIIGEQGFFAPAITNQSGAPLLLEVNGGLETQNRCDCVVPVNGKNIMAGYFKLAPESNVRLYRSGSKYSGNYVLFGTDADGTVADSGTIESLVTEGTGVLPLTVEAAPEQ
jgi:hypothetical protein